MLVSTSLDGKFKVWVLLGGNDEGEEAWACRSVGYYHNLPCRGAQFSGDGSLLAANYGTVRYAIVCEMSKHEIKVMFWILFIWFQYITLWDPIASVIKTVLNGVFQKEEFK